MQTVTTNQILHSAPNLAPLESQREYRQRLSAFIRMHTARLAALDSGISFSALPINSMLILAQTGCGKSYTAARLCEAAGVKLITVDCSSLTKAGYKGCNLGDLLHSTMTKDDLKNAIILFDEVDKMRIDNPEGNPQVNFLKLFEGAIQAEPRGGSPVTLDVSRVSFLFAGAFSGLEQIIRRRVAPRRIGFSAADTQQTTTKSLLSLATMADIRDYGFMEELLGRMGSLLYIPPLTPNDYRTLIKNSKGSVQNRYSNLFVPSGVSLTISDSACDHIAKIATQSSLGARSVDPLVYSCLQNAFSALDSDSTINRVTLSCRNDKLTLLYGHGERHFTTGTDDRNGSEAKSSLTLPDVSIARYLTDDAGIEELCELCLQAFDSPNELEEDKLKVFLMCCFHFMQTLQREEDKVLSSVTKLAVSTETTGNAESCFDRLVESAIRKFRIKDQPCEHFQNSYDAFISYRSEANHRFWVRASKDLRRNWYRQLMSEAC